jgi:hypothetical protein
MTSDEQADAARRVGAVVACSPGDPCGSVSSWAYHVQRRTMRRVDSKEPHRRVGRAPFDHYADTCLSVILLPGHQEGGSTERAPIDTSGEITHHPANYLT